MIFSVALTKRAVVVMTLRQEGVSLPLGLCAGYRLMVVPCCWVSAPQDIPFLSIYKKEKENLTTGMLKGR